MMMMMICSSDIYFFCSKLPGCIELVVDCIHTHVDSIALRYDFICQFRILKFTYHSSSQ